MHRAYQTFAQVYDRFMVDMPVNSWISFIEGLWALNSPKPNLVLDVGCGTGVISLSLAQKGYNVIAIDISEDMLAIAQQKAASADLNVLFLQQDMRTFELYGTVDSVVCICDVVNYLEGCTDLHRFFALVHNYLNPGGLFIFDISTEYKFREVLSNSVFCDIDESAAYIWENSFDPEARINEYQVTLFVENESSKYDRVEELHRLKAFSIEDIKSALELTGFSDTCIYDADDFGEIRNESERVFFSSRKQKKTE